MMLLDNIVTFDEQSMVCEVVVRDDGLFGGNGEELSAWIGLEYMAQIIAAHSSMMDKLAGRRSYFGYLLGTRSYTTNQSSFRVGARLTVRVEKVIDEQGLGIYTCEITAPDVLVRANLNVYQPSSEKNRVVID